MTLLRALDRICKLRRLTNSGNAHEAAAAHREMTALMHKYRVAAAYDNDTVTLLLEEKPLSKMLTPYLMQISYVLATIRSCKALHSNEGLLSVKGRKLAAEMVKKDYEEIKRAAALTYLRGWKETDDEVNPWGDQNRDELRKLYRERYWSVLANDLTVRLLPPPPMPKTPQPQAVSEPIKAALGADEKMLAKTDNDWTALEVYRKAERKAAGTAALLAKIAARKTPPAYVAAPLLGLPEAGKSTVTARAANEDYQMQRFAHLEVD